jgi:hypothetical protein
VGGVPRVGLGWGAESLQPPLILEATDQLLLISPVESCHTGVTRGLGGHRQKWPAGPQSRVKFSG